jgi:RNA-directed DNA polymerase
MEHTEIETLKDLANYLRCDIEFLEQAVLYDYYILEPEIESKLLHSKIVVSRFNIAKKGKSGGFRTVYQCWSHFLFSTLKILNSNLNFVFKPNQFSHGFVKGKNIQTNASSHLNKNLLLSVDIKNFFESISKETIAKSLEELGFKSNVANWISIITTIDNFLPQGFPTSPTLANIVTQKLDIELSQLCGPQITYSRYADDLYFSTDLDNIPLKEITSVIESFDFELNNKKTKFMSKGKKQYVTGLTVFDAKYPRISKRIKRNIRLEIHYLLKFGYKRHIRNKLIKSGLNPQSPDFKLNMELETEVTRDKLYGWLHFIFAIEPEFSKKYYPKLQKAKQ